MTETTTVSVFVAFFAGILSFLSPCVLPLIPSYVSYLTGMRSPQEIVAKRRQTLLHATMFIAGFSLIFVALGLGATALGRALGAGQVWLGRIGGILLLVLGLYLLGAIRWGFLARERRFEFRDKPVGYAGSALVGLFFGAAWTPCIGPILGGILTLSAATATVGQGAILLAAYALGLAIPFFVAAVALDRFLVWFQGFKRWLPWVERAAGVLLVVLGILLITDRFTLLASKLVLLTPEFLKRRL
ncbi:MAG: cytochrome c biogenesis CcdA family protein [Gemmatimonadales bacterium]